MTENEILNLMIENKVHKTKLDFVSYFLSSLYELINSTYLGDANMTYTYKRKHFSYCLDKILLTFMDQKIKIKKTVSFIDYIFYIIDETFYLVDKDENDCPYNIIKFNDLFSIFNINKKTQLLFFIEICNLFQFSSSLSDNM